MSSDSAPPALPAVRRYITTHDASGKAVFSAAFPETVEGQAIPGHVFSNSYTIGPAPATAASASGPLTVNDDADLELYRSNYPAMESLHLPAGAVLRVVDFLPGTPAIMHRTVTVDVGVVLAGELTLELDSGESRALRAGDLVVQRGTMHGWRNDGPAVARVAFVLLGIAPVLTAAGEVLGDHSPWDEVAKWAAAQE